MKKSKYVKTTIKRSGGGTEGFTIMKRVQEMLENGEQMNNGQGMSYDEGFASGVKPQNDIRSDLKQMQEDIMGSAAHARVKTLRNIAQKGGEGGLNKDDADTTK